MLKIKRGYWACILYISITAFYQDPHDYILWDQRSILTWKDFKIKYQLPKDAKADAEVSCTFITSAFRRDGKSDIQIHAAANKNKCWVKYGSLSDKILQHEQGHFDLEEINCRKFRKAVTSFKFNEYSFKHDFDSLSNYYFNICDKQEDQYDTETNHGNNKEEQQIWLERIRKDLKELEANSDPKITVDLPQKINN